MDITIQKELAALTEELKKEGHETADPVTKLLVASLVHQARKIIDMVEALPERIMERLLACFIPRNKVGASPALCQVEVKARGRRGAEPRPLAEGLTFSYKTPTGDSLVFSPLFRNTVLPVGARHMLTPSHFIFNEVKKPITCRKKGQVWLGLELFGEVESLENVSFHIKGTHGVLPSSIRVVDGTELLFSSAARLADIPMMEPFDAQQMSPDIAEMMAGLQRMLSDADNGLTLYISDRLRDRDIFKCKAYPKAFQQILEDRDLDRLEKEFLWILFDFGEGYDVPEGIEIIPNVVPAVNISLQTVSLTQVAPMARLTKGDGSFFLAIAETSLSSRQQGFSPVEEEVTVRDFDASSYDSSLLYRDVRNLYNRFVDDYHAFIGYHSLKDGELVKSLRELVNRIGKGVEGAEVKNRFEEGTYVMRGVALAGVPSVVKVSYLTTNGRKGNTPKSGDKMENKKDAAVEKDIRVIVGARGGENPATPDERYELLRYYTLTADRIYTRADIDAFLRMRIIKEFGREEARRIDCEVDIQGAAGSDRLVRGLYINILCRDEKNYHKALADGFAGQLEREITEKSCISMPIKVTLISKERE